ncbi:MAG: DUF2254 domain-containing protein [Alphaproteobacteria bacterium]
MMSRWRFVLARLARSLLLRAMLYAALAVATALAAVLLERLIPDGAAVRMGADAVDSILTILASSMLAVTTFSLSTVVTAHASATAGATPRAARLMIEDRSAQAALATFVGAFLFSIVGIVALSAHIYGSEGRAVMFVVTIAVIVVVVVRLIGWIDLILRLGRIDETIARVERAADGAIQAIAASPRLGGRPFAGIPEGAQPVTAERPGHIQHLDVEQLQRVAEGKDITIFVVALPGDGVDPARALAWLPAGSADEEARKAVRGAFLVGDARTFEQDPVYGLAVLAGIASRALSPAMNDPGTGLDVVVAQVRVLTRWIEGRRAARPELLHPRVHVPALPAETLVDEAFTPIARDGAGIVEVAVAVQRALAALAASGDAEVAAAARRQAGLALARARAALALDDDRQRVEAAFAATTTGAAGQDGGDPTT